MESTTTSTQKHTYALASLRGLTMTVWQFKWQIVACHQCRDYWLPVKSRPTVFLANVAPQSLFIDDYFIHIKHTENVLYLCLAEVSNTGMARATIVIREIEYILDCCPKFCAKFAYACNLLMVELIIQHFAASEFIEISPQERSSNRKLIRRNPHRKFRAANSNLQSKWMTRNK